MLQKQSMTRLCYAKESIVFMQKKFQSWGGRVHHPTQIYLWKNSYPWRGVHHFLVKSNLPKKISNPGGGVHLPTQIQHQIKKILIRGGDTSANSNLMSDKKKKSDPKG